MARKPRKAEQRKEPTKGVRSALGAWDDLVAMFHQSTRRACLALGVKPPVRRDDLSPEHRQLADFILSELRQANTPAIPKAAPELTSVPSAVSPAPAADEIDVIIEQLEKSLEGAVDEDEWNVLEYLYAHRDRRLTWPDIQDGAPIGEGTRKKKGRGSDLLRGLGLIKTHAGNSSSDNPRRGVCLTQLGERVAERRSRNSSQPSLRISRLG